MTPIQDLIALAIAVTCFTAFTSFVAIKYEVTKSISASVRVLQGADEKSLYSLFILAVAFPMMLVSDTPLGFWAGAFLAIDFAAPIGGDKWQTTLHIWGANVGMGLGLLMLCVDYHEYFIVGAGVLVCLCLHFGKVRNSVWWIETVVFFTVIMGLLDGKGF